MSGKEDKNTLSSEEKDKVKLEVETKFFWFLGAFLSTFFLLLPVIIWLFRQDWIVTFFCWARFSNSFNKESSRPLIVLI